MSVIVAGLADVRDASSPSIAASCLLNVSGNTRKRLPKSARISDDVLGIITARDPAIFDTTSHGAEFFDALSLIRGQGNLAAWTATRRRLRNTEVRMHRFASSCDRYRQGNVD
jgi:hypothetical protein